MPYLSQMYEVPWHVMIVFILSAEAFSDIHNKQKRGICTTDCWGGEEGGQIGFAIFRILANVLMYIGNKGLFSNTTGGEMEGWLLLYTTQKEVPIFKQNLDVVTSFEILIPQKFEM